MTATKVRAAKAKKPRKNPAVYGRDRSASYLLRMAPEELATLKAAAAEQGTTLRDFVLFPALRAAGWPMADDVPAPPEPLTADQEQFAEAIQGFMARLSSEQAVELSELLFGTPDIALRLIHATT